MPLRRVVPLRGTLSCAFGAALLQGPTCQGLSHMGFHTACRIVSCSVVMLTRFPTICDHRQTRSPLENGAAKGRDRRKRQLSNFCVAGEGNCRKIGILQMAVMRDDDHLTLAFIPLRRIVPLRGTLSCAFGAALLQGPTRGGLSHMGFHTACRIVSCSVVMLTRFPTICDYHQTRSPLENGLLADDYLTWAFMPLRRIVPLRDTLSCAFGAALLQGPTRQGLSHIGFHAATTNCASSRHSILRLWRGPSPRAYSPGTVSYGLPCRL